MAFIDYLKCEKRSLGNHAENYVAQELIKQGFAINHQNYRKFYGEVDIIAEKKDLLLFVEVKVRKIYSDIMHMLVPPSKQQKIALVARAYMSAHAITEKICRFDVALVYLDGDTTFKMHYIADAFQAE